MRAAVGFRAHSGWAAMVAVAGTPDRPLVLERRRVIVADPQFAGSRQPYHAAAGLAFGAAEALVRRAMASSRALAAAAVREAVGRIEARGHELAACAVLMGSGKPLPDLEKILASHALIHTAEGVMFRDVLVRGAEDCGLPAIGMREKELNGEALERLAALGKSLGPPWTQDQKYAALAAWTALDRAPAARGPR